MTTGSSGKPLIQIIHNKMKTTRSEAIACILLSLATLLFLPAYGERNDTLPAILDGSMALYDFDSVEPSALPDSLTPVHVSYLARHGARYLTSENKISGVEKYLLAASAGGTLTRRGKECLNLLDEIRRKSAGKWGMLSERGISEELLLGRELAEMYPAVFQCENARVEAVSSYVPRVVETMDHLLLPVLRKYPGIHVSTASGREYDYLTRFFDTSEEYVEWRKNGEWREAYDRFVADSIPAGPALRLVGEKSGLNESELKDLSLKLYGTLQGLRAMGMAAPSTKWMSVDEYRLCWEATNLMKYFEYSMSSLSTVPVKSAADVVMAFLRQLTLIENAGTGQAPEAPAFYGIFGHAETLLPVFSLMGIGGADALPLDYADLPKEWSNAVLTPLGANLEIVYARGGSGKLYAGMRLNGRNIPPLGDGRKIVAASELRKHLLHRLASLL